MYHYDVHLHSPTTVPSYTLRNMAEIYLRYCQRRTTARSNQCHPMILPTYTPNQSAYQVSTSKSLQFPTHTLDKILKNKNTITRSEVKSRLHHNVAVTSPNQCPYQVSTSNTLWFLRYSPGKILTSLQQGQRSYHGHTPLHTYTPSTNVSTKYQLPTSYGL